MNREQTARQSVIDGGRNLAVLARRRKSALSAIVRIDYMGITHTDHEVLTLTRIFAKADAEFNNQVSSLQAADDILTREETSRDKERSG